VAVGAIGVAVAVAVGVAGIKVWVAVGNIVEVAVGG
jgi:hypothetical protein